jgi:hypothetical protein
MVIGIFLAFLQMLVMGIVGLFFAFFMLIVEIYFFLCVYSLYDKLKKENMGHGGHVLTTPQAYVYPQQTTTTIVYAEPSEMTQQPQYYAQPAYPQEPPQYVQQVPVENDQKTSLN